MEVFSPCSLSTNASAFSRGKDSEKTVRTGSVRGRNSLMRSGYSDDEEAQHEQELSTLSQGYRELGDDEEYSTCSSGFSSLLGDDISLQPNNVADDAIILDEAPLSTGAEPATAVEISTDDKTAQKETSGNNDQVVTDDI